VVWVISSFFPKQKEKKPINTVMRFKEFNSNNPDVGAVKQDINKAAELTKQNPTLIKKLSNVLKNLISQAKNLSQNNDPVLQVNSIKNENTLAITSDIQIIDNLLSKLDPIQIKKLNLKGFRNDIQKLILQAIEQSRVVGQQVTSQYKNIYQTSIEQLATKLDNSLEQIGKSQKRLKQQGNVKQNLIDTINKALADMHQAALLNTPESKQQVLNFLKKLTDGFIPIDAVVGEGKKYQSGNILDLAKKYLEGSSLKIWDQVAIKLLGAVPQMIKGTSWGKGELGLALILQPASKGIKGDLQTEDGKYVEIKASDDAAAGGRFDVQGAITSDQTAAYEKLLKDTFGKNVEHVVNTVDPISKKNNKKYRYNLSAGSTTAKTRGGTGIDNVNILIQKTKKTSDEIKDFLKKAIMLTIAPDQQKGFVIEQQYLDEMLSSNGLIDKKNFLINLSKIFYDSYSTKEQYKVILVLNPVSGNYHTIHDSNQLGQAINSGDIIASGGIMFNLTQTKKTPQLGTF
jgi:hypothetical protein